jgi:hypothetical protein
MPRFIDIEVDEVLRITDSAMLIVIDNEEHWIPLSQIDEDGPILGEGDSGEMRITKWIAEKKEIV